MRRKDNDKATKEKKGSRKVQSRTSMNKRNKKSDHFNDRESFDSEDMKSESKNDISWWSTDPEHLAQVANVPFTAATGLLNKEIDFSGVPASAPGIMTFETVLMPGSAQNQFDAVNVAARDIYSFVRHENSGSKNYDPVDLMEYILAMDQAYALIAELKRLVGVYNYYNGLNRYVSKYYIEALGYDYDDLNGRLPELCAIINRACTDLSTKYVPANISLLKRHYWMFSNIFLDEDSLKAQAYAFKPAGFFVRRESTTSLSSGLNFKAYTSETSLWERKLTVDDIKSYIRAVVQPIMVSEDVGIISGDILKAYGSNVFQLSGATTSDLVVPTYNSEVLMQIENMNIVPHVETDNLESQLFTEQRDGVMVCHTTGLEIDPVAANISYTTPYTHTINMHADNVSPEMVMIATRLHNKVTANTNTEFSVYNYCTEIIFGAEMWYNATNSVGGMEFTCTQFRSDLTINSGLGNRALAQFLGAITSFAQHPIIRLRSNETTTGSYTDPVAGLFLDYDNWANISEDTLNNINDYAIRSIYGLRIK